MQRAEVRGKAQPPGHPSPAGFAQCFAQEHNWPSYARVPVYLTKMLFVASLPGHIGDKAGEREECAAEKGQEAEPTAALLLPCDPGPPCAKINGTGFGTGKPSLSHEVCQDITEPMQVWTY